MVTAFRDMNPVLAAPPPEGRAVVSIALSGLDTLPLDPSWIDRCSQQGDADAQDSILDDAAGLAPMLDKPRRGAPDASDGPSTRDHDRAGVTPGGPR